MKVLGPVSLATRLTASIGIIITVLLLLFGWMAQRSINEHFIEQDVDELNAVVQALTHAISMMPVNENREAMAVRFAEAVSGHHNVQYSVWLADNTPIFSTFVPALQKEVSLAQPLEQIAVNTVYVWQTQTETFRGGVLKINAGKNTLTDFFIVMVATQIDFHLHYLTSFRKQLGAITIVGLVLAILATRIAVYQGHAPIRRVSYQLRKIRSDQLHIRLDLNTVPTELIGLAMSFNEMLDGIEAGFQRLSHFSADLAHEIRTPITNMKIQTEVGLSRARNIEAYREILYSNLEEYERMAKMVNDMLFLAQADNNLLNLEPVALDVRAEISALFEYFEAFAEEQDVRLMLVGESIQIIGDRLMFRRALSNLLSNAIRYTPAGKTVSVHLTQAIETLQISVKNPGFTIPEEHLSHIFERFYRMDASRQRCSEGAGLGLAITKSIIEAHHGKLTVSSSNHETVFTISFPIKKA
ncbi:Cu(+)/Ag(+) sensor histidine kinase [Paenalcaligenes hominis]|uniref:Cu(+)/Ag(+) sensor histidine kinase n=1 Tax=Paenalcaligenes hominis TaxID=643674 RepID=UPI00352583A4